MLTVHIVGTIDHLATAARGLNIERKPKEVAGSLSSLKGEKEQNGRH